MLKVAFYPEVNGPVRGTPHVTEALHPQMARSPPVRAAPLKVYHSGIFFGPGLARR